MNIIVKIEDCYSILQYYFISKTLNTAAVSNIDLYKTRKNFTKQYKT